MPDELPPLAQLPLGSISPELAGQIEHDADWARTFGGSDTNLVQRRRHNQDIELQAKVEAQQRAAAQEHLLQTSKTAQSLFFGRIRADQQHEEAQSRMAHADAMLPLNIEARRAQIAASQQAERLSALKEATLASDKLREDADTGGFLAATMDLDENDPQFEKKLIDAQIAHPRAIKNKFVADRLEYLNGVVKFKSKTAQDAENFQRAQALAKDNGLSLKGMNGAKPSFGKEAAPKVSISTTTGVDELTGRPFTTTRKTTSGSVEQVTPHAAAPTSGKAFLNGLGIAPKLPKIKAIPGTGGAIEG